MKKIIAFLLAFLLTPAAASLCGSDLRADGGMTMYYGERAEKVRGAHVFAPSPVLTGDSAPEERVALVTGSGKGVKSALVAGMSAIAILHDHVAYQDFGGADVVVESFNAKLADEAFRMLHM